ncbi:MAG: choice-of-anchor tandem repeat GloVer-containing protein [Terriglobales bacterium]
MSARSQGQTETPAGLVETVVYSFCAEGQPCASGDFPLGSLAVDGKGNLYGVTLDGGTHGQGTVFEVSPPSGGSGPWTRSTLYDFADSPDGRHPAGSLTFDAKGDLFGVTEMGGAQDLGAVFELSPPASGSGPWKERILYSFCSASECKDGKYPEAGVILDSKGNLYGVTYAGGNVSGCFTDIGCGVVFELSPPASGNAPWTETVLHSFCTAAGCGDGGAPQANLIFDAQGNLYGAARYGGKQRSGTVFELSPAASGAWKESTLYAFCYATDCADGAEPVAGVVLAGGKVYGTTSRGGTHLNGTVFELSPPVSGNGYWKGAVLHEFCSLSGCADGSDPEAGLIFDGKGNFYGTTASGGANGGGTVFEISPPAAGSGAWTEMVRYSFCSTSACADGRGPIGGLVPDAKGNFFGVTPGGGAYDHGVVFKLSPPLVATTAQLATTPNPSAMGQTVTMTATVTAADGSTPAGMVVFKSDGAGIGTVALGGSGTAVLNYSGLPQGTHSLTAVYGGSATLGASTSNTVSQKVTEPLSKTAVTSSLNSSIAGQSVTLTAVVSPAGPPTPTGTVGFTSNGTAISGCTGVLLSASRTAACATNALAVGTDAIVATYSGDVNYAGSTGTLTQLVNPVATAAQFVPVAPCRVVDTRGPAGPFGGPAIAGGTFRSFAIPSGPCAGIPATAVAYSLNVTAVPPGPLGYLTIWPTGEGQPLGSTLNSLDGRTKANAATVPAGKSGAVSVYVSNTTNVLLDINGYFVAGGSGSLEFYPLPPCRVADTRKAAGPLGGPSLGANTERDFPILLSACLIPASARAYSLNFTVIPPAGGTLAYLTVWPEGQPRPLVSTLNDSTGTILANAALVKAGNGGDIAVYPSDNTNLVIDVNGYFAPLNAGGLSYYDVAPCRVLDTRNTTGAFSGELTVKVSGSVCAPPHTAQAYVFNATVVPSGALGYLTLWPDGEPQPAGVSTLNALDGVITSNMAIVPTTNGKIDAYASGTTQLVLDISAYFAP